MGLLGDLCSPCPYGTVPGRHTRKPVVPIPNCSFEPSLALHHSQPEVLANCSEKRQDCQPTCTGVEHRRQASLNCLPSGFTIRGGVPIGEAAMMAAATSQRRPARWNEARIRRTTTPMMSRGGAITKEEWRTSINARDTSGTRGHRISSRAIHEFVCVVARIRFTHRQEHNGGSAIRTTRPAGPSSGVA